MIGRKKGRTAREWLCREDLSLTEKKVPKEMVTKDWPYWVDLSTIA